jgi:hypothetical protein
MNEDISNQKATNYYKTWLIALFLIGIFSVFYFYNDEIDLSLENVERRDNIAKEFVGPSEKSQAPCKKMYVNLFRDVKNLQIAYFKDEHFSIRLSDFCYKYKNIKEIEIFCQDSFALISQDENKTVYNLFNIIKIDKKNTSTAQMKELFNKIDQDVFQVSFVDKYYE